MSPLAFHRKIYTPVRINPPYLSYVTQPSVSGVLTHNSSVSLTGLATANYFTTGIGTIGYEWKDSNGVVGVGTTLTLTNLVAATSDGREITQYAIYYPDPTRAGIETFQPGASNSPLASDTVTLSVQATLSMVDQPDSDTMGGNNAQAGINVYPATPNGTTSITLNTTNTFDNFASDVEYTLTPLDSYRIQFILDGAGGGGVTGYGQGGKGGKVTGEIYLSKGTSYKLVVGKAGAGTAAQNNEGGTGGGGTGWAGYDRRHAAGSGGGYTGVFDSSVSYANSLLIAGGGGGGGYWAGNSSYSAADGGDGGGDIGQSGSQPVQNKQGGGGSQTAGGSAGGSGQNQGQTGSALQGGNNSQANPGIAGGAGGGGYNGGCAGGSGGLDEICAGGGGGSGFINSDSSKVINGVFGVPDNAQNTGGKVVISLAT